MNANARVWLAPIFVVWLVLALAGSSGLFTIDELIYLGASQAFVDRFSLTIDNGYDLFKSDALRLWLLVPGPHGLAPQYPSGYPIAAAPFVWLAGARGMIILNTLAAIATVTVCYRLALSLYCDRAIAGAAALILALATFLGEYALGVWPHAISTLVVLAATLFVSQAVAAEDRAARLQALAAGLMVGVGLLVRVDVVFIVPPLAMWAIVFARNPLTLVPPALLGAFPGVAIATALNAAKFGVYFPISYGRHGGGNTSLSSYGAVLVLITIVLAACFLLRSTQIRRRPFWLGIAGAAAAIVGFILVPPLRDVTGDILRGAYVLLIDLRATSDTHPGIIRAADGSVTFWGIPKKALGQSLPWLGMLALLPVFCRSAAERRANLLCGLCAAAWIVPFARFEWHGGLGSNMRYFLPIVPHLAILAAVAWRKVEAAADRGIDFRRLLVGAAGAVMLLLVAGVSISGHAFLVFLQHPLPIALLAALSLAALATRLPGRSRHAAITACRSLFAFALCVAFVLGMLDLGRSQQRRSQVAALEEHFGPVPSPSLILADQAETFAFQLRREGAMLFSPGRLDYDIDHALIRDALGRGFRVFAQNDDLTHRVLAADPGLDARLLIDGETSSERLWEVRRRQEPSLPATPPTATSD